MRSTIETEIAERLARATKGQWRANGYKHVVAEGESGETAICRVYDQPDELFIAHAPEDIAALLARVATLSGLLREARGAIAAYANLPFVGWSGDAYSLTARIDAALGETQG